MDEKPQRKRQWVKWTLAGVLLLLILAKLFFVDLYVIPQSGMYPTIPQGRRFLVRLHPYSSPNQVRRGDVIVYRVMSDGHPYNYIWRVIGLPGDDVDAADDDVTVNRTRLARTLVRTDGPMQIYRETNGDASYEIAISTGPAKGPPPPLDKATVHVPPGHFFVLGDNRHDAADSRYSGLVRYEAIIARKW